MPRNLHLLEATENLRGVRGRVHVILVQTDVQQRRQRLQRVALSRPALAH